MGTWEIANIAANIPVGFFRYVFEKYIGIWFSQPRMILPALIVRLSSPSIRDIVVASARKYHAFFVRYRSDKEVVFSMPNQPAAAAPQAAAANAEGAAAAAPVEGSADPNAAEPVADAEAAAAAAEDDTRSAKSTARSAVSTAAPVEVEPPAPFALRFMLQKTKINFETSLPDLEAAVARMFDELGMTCFLGS
jgi:hypothetical protein